MNTVLKGSPQWSIDSDGVLSVQTTWMCYQSKDSNSNASVSLGWLEFQNEVEGFAGKPGDAYKIPVATEGIVDVTEYEESKLFTVQEVNWEAVDGRSHYEVTFTNIQNMEALTRVGGIDASVNENNEKTRSARYRITLAKDDDGTALTALMEELKSGTVVIWAGEDYLIESTDYTNDLGTTYTVSITAKDMSEMMIGLPDIQTDSFGNKTVNVVWRYSEAAFDESELPAQGSDASEYIGGREGFIVQSVDCQHHGVLGYHVSITAVSHRTDTRISSTRRDTKDESTGRVYTEWESQFQVDEDYVKSISGKSTADLDAHDYIPEGASFSSGTVREVSYDEYVSGKYNMRIKMSNQPEIEAQALEETWDAQVSQDHFTLDMQQTGWAKGPSGEPYEINYPPTTKYNYLQSPKSLVEMYTATAGATPNITEQQVLDMIKVRGTIGFDKVVGIQAFDADNNLRWLNPTDIAKLTSLDSVQSILLEGFVYAQPTMTVEGESIRNQLFREWKAQDSCPIFYSTWIDNAAVRDKALPREYMTYKFQYHEVQVTLRYKIELKKALKQDTTAYYKDAITKVKCANYTSYKGVGIAYKALAVIDDDGDVEDYTEITCSIHALLTANKGKPVWNPNYDQSCVL